MAPESWAAYSLDSAVLALADRVEEAVDRARGRGGSPALVAGRVRAAVARVLTTELERRAEEDWRRRAESRNVELRFEPGGQVRAVVTGKRRGG